LKPIQLKNYSIAAVNTAAIQAKKCWLVRCLAELAQKSEPDRPHR